MKMLKKEIRQNNIVTEEMEKNKKIVQKNRNYEDKEIKNVKLYKISNDGITLMSLIIIIIVLLILAGITISALSGDNGILDNASLAKLSTEFANYKEEVELYKMNKMLDNYDFEADTLTAGQTLIEYEGKPDGETGNIQTVIQDLDDKYLDKFIIIKGNLYLMAIGDTSELEIKAAEVTGIEVMPYEISEEGELLSSNVNLALQGEEGTLTIPEIVTSIGEGAFSGQTNIKKVIIPDTVKEIKRTAFSNMPSLEEVVMGNNVETIGYRAFYNCPNLQKINLPDSIMEIGSNCFREDVKLSEIIMPKNLEIISDQMFHDCTGLKSIQLPENLESIGLEAFVSAGIENIKFPENLKTIGESAFIWSKLKNIDTSESKYFQFEDGILYSKNYLTLYFATYNVQDISINEKTEVINGGAFTSCRNLLSINIPKNVKNIGEQAFSNENLQEIIVDSNNQYFMSDSNNNLYSKDGTELYRIFDKGNVTIRDGVQNIKRGAFKDNGSITSITLPDTFLGNEIAWGVFPTLDYLYLPASVNIFEKIMYNLIDTIEVSPDNPYFKSIDGKYITNLDETELYWVKSDLQNVNIPDTIEKIMKYAFQYVIADTVILPKNVTEIRESGFAYTNIKRLEIQSNIKSIASTAFSNATNLTEVYIDKKKSDDPELAAGSPWGNPIGDRAIFWKD